MKSFITNLVISLLFIIISVTVSVLVVWYKTKAEDTTQKQKNLIITFSVSFIGSIIIVLVFTVLRKHFKRDKVTKNVLSNPKSRIFTNDEVELIQNLSKYSR